jgi:hypothetical protein
MGATQSDKAEDEEAFLRNLTSPEEERSRWGFPPYQGGFRWFRSPNVVCLEKVRRARKRETDDAA